MDGARFTSNGLVRNRDCHSPFVLSLSKGVCRRGAHGSTSSPRTVGKLTTNGMQAFDHL